MQQCSSSKHKVLLGAWSYPSCSASSTSDSADKRSQTRLTNPVLAVLRQQMRDMETVACLVCRQGEDQQIWVRFHLLHPRTWAGLALLHPSLGSESGGERRISIVQMPFPTACPWSPFSSTYLTVPCPSSPPQRDPWIGFVLPTPGRIQGGSSTKARNHPVGALAPHLPCGHFTAHLGNAGQPPCSPVWGEMPRRRQELGSDPAGKCSAAELDSATFEMRV